MKKVLLLDAIYINNSGGKILLDYLIQELEKSGKKVFYLLDKRVENNIPHINTDQNNVVFLEASLIKRHQFYVKNRNMFSSVLCFGDLPPSIRLKAKVFTYFHQQLYIKVPKDTPAVHKFLFFLKRSVLQYFFNNSDFWILQTEVIRDNFKNKFKPDSDKLLIIPYYPEMKKINGLSRQKNTFVYISHAPPHKNHVRLINAFCVFYDKHKKGKLIVTISSEFTDLCNLITDKINLGYPIDNIGFVERDSLSKIYQSCEYLVFPSLAESFGLGLVEAIENGCKIIGADLPYMYAVCEPSLTFNPLDEKSISDALSLSLLNDVKPSVSKIQNQIDHLVSIL